MRQFKQAEISKGIILFCRAVKLGRSCTSKELCLSTRNARLLKTVLTHKFSKSSGAPYDFPRLFICDNKHLNLYHKCTTPNDIDLSDLKTVEMIMSLTTYVGRQEYYKPVKKKDGLVADKVLTSDDISFSLKKAKDIIITKSKNEFSIRIIF